MSIEVKRLDGSRCHLERGYRPQHRPHCVRWGWGPSSPKRGTAAPTLQPMSMAKRLPISATAELLYKVTTDGVFDHATYRSRQKQAKTLRHMRRDSSALGARQFGTQVRTVFRTLRHQCRSVRTVWTHQTSAEVSSVRSVLGPKCP